VPITTTARQNPVATEAARPVYLKISISFFYLLIISESV